MTHDPARIAEIRRMVQDPALEPIKAIARMCTAIFDIITSGQRGELESALIARGFSLGDIRRDLPSALCFIDEFGKGSE